MRVAEVRSEENHIFAWAAAVIITGGRKGHAPLDMHFSFLWATAILIARKEENGKTPFLKRRIIWER